MKSVNLSNAEWTLMNALWEKSPKTITELEAQFADSTAWSKHTVITMLGRLEKKGAVLHREGARAKQFYPAIDPVNTRFHETKNFLERLYDGKLGLMLNTFVQEQRLSKEEIDELYDILHQAEEEKR